MRALFTKCLKINLSAAMIRVSLFLLATLPLHPASAAEVPPHIARGHLLAAFCGASPDNN
jgi:hypothetical protein